MQRRDNLQFREKYKLNLKLTVFFTSHKSRPVFFQKVWSAKSRDKICQNIWNLKGVWITTNSLSDFRAYCQVSAFARNGSSNIILQETCCVFWPTIICLARLICCYFYPLAIALCVVWFFEVINIFSSRIQHWKSHCGVDGFGVYLRVWQYFCPQLSRAKGVTQWRKIPWSCMR